MGWSPRPRLSLRVLTITGNTIPSLVSSTPGQTLTLKIGSAGTPGLGKPIHTKEVTMRYRRRRGSPRRRTRSFNRRRRGGARRGPMRIGIRM